MQPGYAGFFTVLLLGFLLCHWLAGRVVGVVRRMTIDCWVLSLHGKGCFARAGCCLVQCKEQKPERERAPMRKGGYWVCGLFPHTIYPYFLVWILFFGSLTLNVKGLLLQHIGN
jgi:hypothetical protein